MTIMSLYAQQLVRYPELGISLDFSKLPLDDAFLSSMPGRIDRAFADMKALESGAIANPDEKRMVGHYWLRNSSLAPTPELKAAIDGPLADVKAFGRDVLDGKITPPRAEQYSAALVIGIGGSALGPELVADAIPAAGLDMFFLDNTDPDGMYRVLESLPLEETLVVVISKSGGTIETLAMGPLTLYDLAIFINPAAEGDEVLVGMNALGRLELVQKERQLLLRPLQE